MEFIGEFGVVFGLLALLVGAWWSARKRSDTASAVAGLVWAPLAAGIALLANNLIRGFVKRPRPFVDHPQELEVLVAGKSDYSFVSDHSTLVAAIAVGIFMVNRKYGVFALGMAVTLLLAPLAMMMLTPLATTVANSRWSWLVRADAGGSAVEAAGPVTQRGPGGPAVTPVTDKRNDSDLAA